MSLKVWSVKVGELYRGHGRNRQVEGLVTPLEIPYRDGHLVRENIISGKRVLSFRHFGQDVAVPAAQVQLLTLSNDRSVVQDVEYFHG